MFRNWEYQYYWPSQLLPLWNDGYTRGKKVQENGSSYGCCYRLYCRVGHIAKSWVRSRATSFSHPFYLVIYENAKKVGKSWYLGVPISIYNLCSNFPIGIRLFHKNIKFEPFFVLLHAHMTSQSIRHPKFRDNKSKQCPNRTLFVDFIPFEFLISNHKNQGDRDI